MRYLAFLAVLLPLAALAGEPAPVESLLAKVRADYPGEILKVERDDGHGREVYEVKVLTADGRVMKLIYDVRTLELIKAKGKRLDHEHR